MKTSGCANTINSPEFLIIIQMTIWLQLLYTRRLHITFTTIFTIDPLLVYILIDVVHRLIKCTEIYFSTELSEIAHGYYYYYYYYHFFQFGTGGNAQEGQACS